MTNPIDAYEDGWEFGYCGDSYDNPHEENTEAWEEWDAGFRDGQQEVEEENEW